MELVRMQTPFVLVTGGKGGVGKSTVAANLGVQLAREGHRVLLVDLDLGLANLDLLLDVGSGATLEDVVHGGLRLAECVRTGPAGLSVLAGGSGDERMGRLTDDQRHGLLQELRELSADYDIVLGDSSAGIGPDVLRFAAVADRVLVVTTPELPALTDAYGLIKAMDQLSRRDGLDVPTPEVVVNLAVDVEEGTSVANKLRAICERFLSRSPRQAGWLPRSRSVAAGAAHRRPFALAEQRGLEQLCLRQVSGRLQRLIPRPTPALVS